MGAEASFDEFVRSHQRRLWQALVPVAGPEGAEDALAETLGRVWRDWDRIAEMDNTVGYVYTAARRTAVRSLTAPPALPTPDAHVVPDFEPGLLPALEQLSEMQRQVVYLVDGFGWGLTDTARVLEISVSTVRNHRGRALERLRELMKVRERDG